MTYFTEDEKNKLKSVYIDMYANGLVFISFDDFLSMVWSIVDDNVKDERIGIQLNKFGLTID